MEGAFGNTISFSCRSKKGRSESIKKELIDYRRDRAKETLKDAKILFNKGSLFSTVNRIYYAVFYEVNALLLTKNLSSSKHSGVLSIFNKEFVKQELVSKDLGKLYNRMFEFRQKSDYEEFSEFEREDVERWLKQAEKFIEEVEKVISKIG